MTETKVIAVGGPPTFRQQVARALEREPDAIEWTATVSAAESTLAERKSAVNVVVLSQAVKELDAFGLAEYVGKESPASAVLLVRDRLANGILPAAMRAGIREVIDLSHGGQELREALSRASAWSENLLSVRGTEPGEAGQDRAKVVSVFSSKGGTGKTFLTTGLAAAVAKETGEDTAILDLELDFGQEPTHALQDLLSIGDEQDRETILKIGVPVREHLWVYASPQDPANEGVSGEAVGKVIAALRRNFKYVILDGTANYSDAALSAFDMSDSVCLIAGLDVVGVRHLSVALQTMLSLGFPSDRFRFILNRADSKVGLSVENVEQIMKLKADGLIPSSRLVPASLNQGRTVVDEHPNSDVAKALTALARKLVDVKETAGQRRRLFRK